ncbi:peroxisomal ATPase PEX6 isoform X1 [Cherax quadricarinatus]|nr:peroxisomal ATPase PEX6-like isoform X1 [Cherax quadricarinatus]XP_053641892.1 peroxisomal ATPase PEX6-like isoform X1 [Cherax quadricarinatus]XP_053641893.1 peroxisomal ATPase PEX6-like isoform X1 [Cherax quadricarinatus]XP_053641894.1 peroxisomal ATPase PEX6-like isoform X1 [Cherax quadricarinatus]
MAEESTVLRTLSYMQMLLYVCSLIKVTRPHIVNPLEFAAKQTNYTQSRHRLKVLRVSLKTLYCRSLKVISCEPDINAVVLVNKKIALCLGLRCGQWQNVLCCLENPPRNGASNDNVKIVRRRWIMIGVCPDVAENQCLVSPVLYHNLQQGIDNKNVVIEFDSTGGVAVLSDAVKRIFTLWKDAHGAESILNINKKFTQHTPDTAVEVYVQVVESSKYKCGSQLELLLKDYFRVPKLITVGDILIIPVPSHLGYEFTVINSVIPPKYIVIKISGAKTKPDIDTKQSSLVTMGITSLYLAGTVQCYHPILAEKFDDKGNVDIPPVLNDTFVKVKEVLHMEMQEREQVPQSLDGDICSKSIATHWKGFGKNNLVHTKESSDILRSRTDPHHGKDEHYIEAFVSEGEQGNIGGITLLLMGQPGSGIEQIIKLAASALGLGVLWINSWHLKGDTSGGTEAKLRQTFLRASTQGPCVLALLSVHCFTKDRDGGEDARVVSALREEVAKLSQRNSHVFLVATAPDRTSLSDDLWSVFSYQESIEVPSLRERTIMLDWLLSKWLPAVQTQTVAQRTAGYVLGDFQALINAAHRHYLQRVTSKEDDQLEDFYNSIDADSRKDVPLLYTDLLKALDELQSVRSEALGAPRIPEVQWKEVGGLEDAKRQIINTIQLPLRYPSLVSSRLRRSGVLLYGPPGTGKTLLAKAVATECGLNFMSVKGPELLNMYVGQSEENVRQVFARARAAAPCVIFFDELDSLAPNRGQSGDSGGVMDRIVSALLAELDGVASAADVFVLAATNRPDLIDPALLRPGRFEKLVFLGVCKDRDSQIKILKAVTCKIPMESSVSLTNIAEMLPLTLTGADIYALCTDALYAALHRTIANILSGLVQEENATVEVEENDFYVAAAKLVPSVAPEDLTRYHALATTASR